MPERINSIEEVRVACERIRCDSHRIGFVPTMGALHEGHLSLVRIAAEQSDFVVVSIFVNPIQFGPGEDLERYPRDLDGDMAKLAEVGVDVVFTPDAASFYPAGYATYVEVEGITGSLCGASRPGHFRGVATVVTKLLHCVWPHVAVFGRKDYQQYVVLSRMAADMNIPCEMVAAPIIREPDGLAMSSRNAYLSPEEREQATVLKRSLDRAQVLAAEGVTNAAEIHAAVTGMIKQAPSATIDYVEIVHPDSLEPVEDSCGGAVVALAVWFGTTRLIDNCLIEA